ncbi:MAG: hypothetical protein ABSB59_08005 [Streptosporangiaceae bacterium]
MGEQSEIARTARSGLVGLVASLEDAIGRCPHDEGREPAIELISRLNKILADWPAAARPVATSAADAKPVATSPAVPRPGHGPDDGLRALAAAFVGDPAAREYLDEQSLAALAGAAADGAELWRTLHLCLLRLPGPAADSWRAELAAFAVPETAGHAGWRTLPGELETILVAPGPLGATRAEGIRTSARGLIPDDVLAALGPDGREPGPGATELARLSALLLHLSELDDNLVLCLESVLYMGSRRLDGKYRQLYRADLLGRLREYARREPGSPGALEALVEIDEALNSLTHRPPAAGGSWWAQVRQQSRRMVDRAAAALNEAGADVEILPLGLRYRDVRDLTAGNDVAFRSGGKPGDVLACLKLWTRIGDRVIPGRVMYRA